MKWYLVSPASLCVYIILSSLATKHQTTAFVHHSRCLGVSKSLLPVKATPDGAEANRNDNDDADFYRDLRQAKKEKLGRSIPPEQARESAVQAEGDFLQAMRETKEEFEKAKEELGSDGAVDLFLGRIREEDERNEDEN